MATPRRVLHARSGSVDDTPSGRGRSYPRHLFKATNVWNDIQSTFVEKIPRKRHRRQFTYIDDSFTGKEAVDFLMELIPKKILNGREVGRENCSALLQKFLNQKVFYRYGAKPDAKDQAFKDNYTLYCFPTIPNQVPKLIAEGSSSTLRRTNSVGHVQRKKSLSPIRANSPWSPHRIPDSPGDLMVHNKRLSMSHGNLTQFSMVSSRLSPGIGSFQELSGDKTPTCDRTRADTPTKEEEHEGIYDFLPFRRRKKHVVKEAPVVVAPPPPPPAERPPSIRVPSIVSPRPPQNPPPASHPPVKVANRMLTEVDLWSVWKTCLLNRLKTVLGTEDLSFLSWNLNGYEIKWNCEKIGSSGIVKSRSDSDDFSAYVMRLMKYLEQFPFHSSSVNVITYRENQEKDVFKTMCSYLERDPSLLTAEEAAAILDVMTSFHEKAALSLGGRQTRAGSHFSGVQRTPFARLGSVQRGSVSPLSILSTPLSNYSDLPPAIQLNGLNEQIAFSAAGGSTHGKRKSIFSPMHQQATNRERRSMSDSSMDGRLCVEDAMMLPGLKQSPEMLKRISEMCVSPPSGLSASPDTSFSYKTASSHLSPIVNKLARDDAECLLSAVSLVLLTLPCSRRRRIHHLVRFMNKLCANHCVQLDAERGNRYVILESLAQRIVPVDGVLTPLQALQIVTLLVDHERKVFNVDELLRKEVQTMVTQIQREKVVQTEEIVLNGTPPTNVVQFCEPVNKEAYQEQNDHKDDFLLPLLDRYINDENMKPSEREKKLKQFQRAHPDVYLKRFSEAPESAKKPAGFLRRVFKR